MSRIRVFHSSMKDFFHTDKIYNLIYVDPPFNTGKVMSRGDLSYRDVFDNEEYTHFTLDYMMYSLYHLASNGTMIVHCDWHECHRIRGVMDYTFGRENFLNEIIWAYDYGARSKSRWSCKHDNILIYVRDKKNYTFNYDAIERIPYMAPGLVGKEKAERGKTLTDVWWHTIVPTNGKEKTGYLTQKPLGIIKRLVEVHSKENDECLDFFAGSGTFGEACMLLNRNCDLVDENEQAVEIMEKRLGVKRCDSLSVQIAD